MVEELAGTGAVMLAVVVRGGGSGAVNEAEILQRWIMVEDCAGLRAGIMGVQSAGHQAKQRTTSVKCDVEEREMGGDTTKKIY
jgi:hypothetical protein